MMKKPDKISDIMSRDVITVDINSPLHEVNKIFAQVKIRHLPVLSGKSLVGMISRTDIMRISFGNTFEDDQQAADDAIFDMLSVNQVMKHSPETISKDQSIKTAAEILADREYHALPVTDNNKLIGIVTTTDLIKHYCNSN